MRRKHSSRRTIRASEIGEYNYCSRAWWYKHVVKIAPPDEASANRLEAGRQAHSRHGRVVALSGTLKTIGVIRE